MQTIFGPVPSRRLGRSLGIDVIAPKTCTFDCIYCESGATTRLTVTRELFVGPDKVLHDLEAYFRKYPGGADTLTFSSAGEPTLYLALGELIHSIKKRFPGLPLVVLTNGSLLWDESVRRGLMGASRVVPSLDAAVPEVFRAVNRPHPSLGLDRIIEGLDAFRRDYPGQFHLEILLASGWNDNAEQLAALRKIVDRLDPHRVELNTIVRPPAAPGARGLTAEQMSEAARFFPRETTDVVGSFCAAPAGAAAHDLPNRILETIGRRPCTAPELAASLGISEKEVDQAAALLEQGKKLERRSFGGLEFLCPAGRKRRRASEPL